ncbi:DUF4393 domain-containing protein [Solibacillus sp. CAU 1738]|uniref:DUF4393 domain-containing protein n=1 Tax=Solibacillus sp. CAU 1738 TaxID=3140363 RepID=UPI003261312A
MSLEINLVPKFIDKAMSPVAESVGNSIANLWDLTFSNYIKLWKQKQEFKHELNYRDYVEKVNTKIAEIQPDRLAEPSLHIIGPAIEASKYYIDSEELREMFANLIAASMNSDKTDSVHPSYVEIIKQLTSDEAKILRYSKGRHIPTINVVASHGTTHSPIMLNFSDIAFKAECEYPNKVHAYLENLNRLGLINLNANGSIADDKQYTDIENHPMTLYAIELANLMGKSKINRSYADTTSFGRLFYEICIKN